MVEIVQDPEVTANLAIHNLVQVSKIQLLLIWKGSLWYQVVIFRLLVAGDDIWPYLDKKYNDYFLNHLIPAVIIKFEMFFCFQRIVFGDLGQLG